MRGSRHVFAQVAKKLAIGTTETVRLVAGRNKNAEDFVFGRKRSGYERMQTAGGEPLWKRRREPPGIRLVNERSLDADRQSILVNRNAGLRHHAQCCSQRLAVRPDI